MRSGWLFLLISLGTLAAMPEMSVEPKTDEPSHDQSQQSDAHEFVTRRVSPSVITGPTPHGVETMRQLRRLGIRTLVSVDGQRPDVEAAAALGMTYVHIPSGYDGVSTDVQAALTRVMHERELPAYVHCHHGKHRGPAAAAICAMIAGEINPTQAVSFLETAGTSHDYGGLWKSVGNFEPLPDNTPLPELHQVAELEPLVDAMVRIDGRFDELKELIERAKAGKDSSLESIAAEAQSAANVLHQELREASRLLTTGRPADFVELLDESARQAEQIAQEIEAQPQVTPPTLELLQNTCTKCHAQFRN